MLINQIPLRCTLEWHGYLNALWVMEFHQNQPADKYFNDDAVVSIFNPSIQLFQRARNELHLEPPACFTRGCTWIPRQFVLNKKGNEKLTGRRLLINFRQVVVASLKVGFMPILFLFSFDTAFVWIDDGGIGSRDSSMSTMPLEPRWVVGQETRHQTQH